MGLWLRSGVLLLILTLVGLPGRGAGAPQAANTCAPTPDVAFGSAKKQAVRLEARAQAVPTERLFETISKKLRTSRLAPPTRAPSTSWSAVSAAMFSGLTLPP